MHLLITITLCYYVIIFRLAECNTENEFLSEGHPYLPNIPNIPLRVDNGIKAECQIPSFLLRFKHGSESVLAQ